MDRSFWLQKWKKNEIGFHKKNTNPLLVEYFPELLLSEGSRIFLPLCGKTLDIAWLLAKGYRIVGIEFCEPAIEQLFAQLKIEPNISQTSSARHFSAPNIDIIAGDFFALTPQSLGKVDAVYDRAALIALPKDMRFKYSRKMDMITGNAPQLLITIEYDQDRMDGPPFSVSNEELCKHYDGVYNMTCLTSLDIPGGVKGICPGTEHVWLLKSLR